MSTPGVTTEYVFYVGENIGNISLWERSTSDWDHVDWQHERPIYANTRGQGVWYSSSPDEYHGTEPVEPTEAFWNALKQITDPEGGRIDVEDCEWYECEVVQSTIQMVEAGAVTDPMEDLLAYAEDKQ
jgi:hypothetical protein